MLKNIYFRAVEHRKSAGNKRKRNVVTPVERSPREEVIEKSLKYSRMRRKFVYSYL